jgi:NAD-dependent deacetylase
MQVDTGRVQAFRQLVAGSSRIVGFTGAGLSTESGIPDYRGTGGTWQRYQPVPFDQFLSDADKRKEYWVRTLATWPAIRDARPNAGHAFFTDLARRGKLAGIITQNIDGLHEKSGIPSELIVNLHGSALSTVCLSCGERYPSEEIAAAADLARGIPACPRCAGLLKPDTVSFGQPLRAEDLRRAGRMAAGCDLMVAMGSTLIVSPAAEIPLAAKRSGARLVIVTLSETPLDGEADLVLNVRIGELMEALRAA